MSGRTDESQRFERRHELVHRVLRSNILKGHLPRGLVLLEAPLADMLQTSRAPVQRALLTLERADLVHRFEGRGFLVGDAAGTCLRASRSARTRPCSVGRDGRGAADARFGRMDPRQSRTGGVVLPRFGEFRMIEAEVAAHFNVSRTVIRDVLGRLQERGLLRKTQSSRWIAGPLTAHALKECYDLRGILEPAALVAAAPRLDRAALAALADDTAGRLARRPPARPSCSGASSTSSSRRPRTDAGRHGAPEHGRAGRGQPLAGTARPAAGRRRPAGAACHALARARRLDRCRRGSLARPPEGGQPARRRTTEDRRHHRAAHHHTALSSPSPV